MKHNARTVNKEKLHRWATLLGGVLIAAMSIAGVALCAICDLERLQRTWIFNIAQDVFGLLICCLVYYGCVRGKKRETETSYLFAALLTINAFLLFSDMCCWLTEGTAELRILVALSNTAFYANGPLLLYFAMRYMNLVLSDDGGLLNRAIPWFRYLLIPMELLCWANLFLPIYFTVSEEGAYQRTAGYPISFAYFLLSYLVLIVTLARSKASRKQKQVLTAFLVTPLISTALAFLTYGLFSQYSATLVSIVLMYSVLYSEQNDKLAATEAELSTATRIQANMLPNTFPAFPKRREFELYASMIPAKEVGGDFYDFFLVDEDHLALVMADVSGKGVPAALFMMTSRTMLKDAALTGLDPAQVLSRVNGLLCENNKDGMFVTVWLGILEISTGTLTYADAGHEKLLAYRDDAWGFLPKGKAPALAFAEPEELDEMPEQYRFHNETIRLRPGDVLLQYTDGVTEATYDVNAGEDAIEAMFGEKRLLDAANELGGAAPGELLEHIRARIDAFVNGGEQFDDITMLGLRYQGN